MTVRVKNKDELLLDSMEDVSDCQSSIMRFTR